MARQPLKPNEAAGHVNLNDRPSEEPPVETPRRPKGRRRRTPGDIVPAQHETPSGDDSPAPEQTVVPSETLKDDNPLKPLLDANLTPIDLFSALQLAGIQNNDILVAQQRVVEAVALRQLAAAQFLPTLNYGGSIDSHRGNLQQSSGNILSVQRDALYVGAGASAIAAGTVNIPGVMWNLNLSEAIYNYLASRKEVDRSAFESRTVEQDVLLAVSLDYTNLVRAQGARSVAARTRDDARELSRITAAYATTGQGSQADADRAATELARREADLVRADGTVLTASARLCRQLHLDPSMRLLATETYVLPRSVVPEMIPLPELLAIALVHRPELLARRAAIAQALLNLESARLLPFSPTVFLGFSAGDFGGGSNIASQPVGSQFFARGQSRFGNYGARQDLDVMAYWTLRNLGVGNRALIEATASRLRSADLEELATLDKVRAEVAAAHAGTHARFARIRTCELAIQSSTESFQEDLNRVAGLEGRPLETVDSLRLLNSSRLEYLNAILDYNESQFQLYVALGKPPVDVLIRPVDSERGPPAPMEPVPTEVPAPAGRGN
jgi:outer membrane protein TolC